MLHKKWERFHSSTPTALLSKRAVKQLNADVNLLITSFFRKELWGVSEDFANFLEGIITSSYSGFFSAYLLSSNLLYKTNKNCNAFSYETPCITIISLFNWIMTNVQKKAPTSLLTVTSQHHRIRYWDLQSGAPQRYALEFVYYNCKTISNSPAVLSILADETKWGYSGVVS